LNVAYGKGGNFQAPRVEYSLTALGASLSEPITTLDRWVENHLQDIAMAQREFDRHDG
jgi:DNA-binding HxlR family transcriptional regulator